MNSKRLQVQEDLHFRVLRLVQEKPDLSQRDLAAHLGISYGRVNYLLNALIEKGLIKLGRFAESRHKFSYYYLLTPAGMKRKAAITQRFLQRKLAEYDALRVEIEMLKRDIDLDTQANPPPPDAASPR